jgi:excinuclease ABC subunit C
MNLTPERVRTLPHLPGVYRMLGAHGDVLYVGKALDLNKRVASYFRNRPALSPRIALMVASVASVEVTVTRSEAEALLLENNLIKSLKPRYNILYRDDKSYPYLTLGSDAFPRLGFYRGGPDGRQRAWGPFPGAGAVRASIHLLQRVFRLRTCADSVFRNRSRPCLLHQIDRCTAPCVGLVSQAEYAEDVANAALFLDGREDIVVGRLERRMQQAADALDFERAARERDRIRALRKVREVQYVDAGSDTDADVIAAVESGGELCVNLVMIRGGRHLGDRSWFPERADGCEPAAALEAFLAQHYLDAPVPRLIVANAEIDAAALAAVLSEQSGQRVAIVGNPRGERRAWLQMAEKNAQLALEARLASRQSQQARLARLQWWLGGAAVQRIECFDVSHTMGEAAVASCVVYDRHAMQRGEYRRYNIEGIEAGDDCAALRQALTRRFRRLVAGEGQLPDLLLVDGGTGQVAVAKRALEELGQGELPLIGIAKGEGRKPGLESLVFPDARVLRLPADDPAAHLLQQIRDEAHRFAIEGHRARRSRTRHRSALEGIDGVGPKRRQRLLARFGGIKGVAAASLDDLCAIEGISRDLAARIHRALH